MAALIGATVDSLTSAAAPLSVVITGDDPITPPADFDYVATVTNAGPGTAGKVVLTVTLNDKLTYVDASGTGWTCTESGSVVTCKRDTLASGAAPDVTITVTPANEEATAVATAQVTADTSADSAVVTEEADIVP